jgi:branched-chain amino acid transport system permease protein
VNRYVYFGALCVLVLAIAPFYIYPIALMKVMCFALYATAFNLLFGYTGLLSFGHAAFFGAGSYAASYALKHYGVSTELGLLIGCVAAAVLGLAIGALATRRYGIYFSMITLAMAQLVYFGFLQLPFSGGEDGLQGVPRGEVFGIWSIRDDLAAYCFVTIVVALGIGAIVRVVHSPFGQVLRAIRDNEARAISLGYNVKRYKLGAFVLSATIAGCAGAAKAIVLGFATLSDAAWTNSGDVVLMTLLGGVGTTLGPIVGATVVVTLHNELADKVGTNVTIIVGALFIACVLAFRRGIVGELSGRLRSRTRQRLTPLDQRPRLLPGDSNL